VHLESRTGFENQEFRVVNFIWRPTDAQQHKIKDEEKQLCCNAPEIVEINIKSPDSMLGWISNRLIIPLQYTG